MHTEPQSEHQWLDKFIGIPAVHKGTVEIRPILDLTGLPSEP